MNDVARLDFAPQTPARFSIDEFMRLVGTGAFNGMGRVELVEGVIVRMSPALPPHMYLKRQVFVELHALFDGGDLVAYTELTLQLGPATVREADVAVLRPFAAADASVDPTAVLLLVEIADSSLSEDMGAKLRDYARAGIPHYWVVDVNGRRVHLMTTPLDGDYAERRLVAFGDPIPVPGTDRTIAIG
jgi:Uma2 family endonuclease